MNIGIIGPPQSGKTTTFHLLTGTAHDPAASFKREVQHAVTDVPDRRVDKLSEMSQSKKTVYVTVEYVDTPGIEHGGSKTEWFAAAIEGGVKNSDALLTVVRAFGEDSAARELNPQRDILAIQDELVFADLVVLENKLSRLEKQRRVKAATPDEKHEAELLHRGLELLQTGQPLRLLTLDAHDKKALRGYQFLSEKPLLAIVNAADDRLQQINSSLAALNGALAAHGIQAIALSALVEAEIAGLDSESQAAFMSDLGVEELARDRVLRASYALLGLQSFLTTGDKESRGWSIHKGDSALDAAGVIHTDLAKGFIRAEVVNYDDFVREGGYAGCRAKGLVRLEGKEYPIKDGDILVIRHSG
ncbi:redox-regulated ATPase YchF [candidate division KSB1 bacterium]|nr:redox-regulated ATPase YchF [candidate division KSB1 bacterium]